VAGRFLLRGSHHAQHDPGRSGAGALLVLAPQAHGQIDYRNLDEGRPVATEDAYPIERFAFELLVPYRFESEHSGADFHVIGPEVEFGVLRNTQIGVKTLLAAVRETGETDWGLAGIRVFGLYNFNTESGGIPRSPYGPKRRFRWEAWAAMLLR
jgi:hypothetical protein